MRARLKRGRLVPPFSVFAAKARLASLNQEIARIDNNLESMPPDSRLGAERALKLFRSEAFQLTKWLENEKEDTFQKEIDSFWNSET